MLQAGGCTVCQISAHVAGSGKGQGCAAPSGVGVWLWACAREAWSARYISACKSAKFTGRRWVGGVARRMCRDACATMQGEYATGMGKCVGAVHRGWQCMLH